MPLLLQPRLPEKYMTINPEEIHERISTIKKILGKELVILGHHYQRDEIIRHADFRGDSFLLSRQAAGRAEARYIVFCGVHFMAESADILSGPDQQVILPDLTAGCSMADMADLTEVRACWDELAGIIPDDLPVPITYMNSAADLKAFCGEHAGAVCTSSNADRVVSWAMAGGSEQTPDAPPRKVLFFPDQHLGRNTAFAMGIPLTEMILWDPNDELGGNTPEQIKRARVILWKGHCSVHQRFTLPQIQKVRAEHPETRIIVHPECRFDVVQAADDYGSTEKIINEVNKAPAGTSWSIGTEINLVNRLAQAHPEQHISCLNETVCPCSTMYRINPQNLLWVLENLLEGNVVNRITVPIETARWAKVALDRMLVIS